MTHRARPSVSAAHMRAGGLLIIVLTLCACQRTTRDIQLDEAKRMTPRSYNSVSSNTAEPDAVVTLKVRAWIDPSYAAETVRWRERLGAQLDRASVMAERTAPMRFQLVGASTWSPESDELPDLLQELAQHDDGDGVDLVVGMTDSFPGLTQSQHALGYASVLGKHIVLRAMNDSAERQFFEEQFDHLKKDERLAVYRERLRHKEAAVFLHEVGHALGALHTRADGWLMSPHYGIDGDRFCSPNEEIVSETLAMPREDHSNWERDATDVVRRIANSPDGEMLDNSVVGALDERRDKLRADEVETLKNSQRLAEQGDLAEAKALAAGLVERLPDHPAAVAHYCQISLLADAESADAREACDRAMELAPDSYAATVNRAFVHHRQGELSEAAALAARAHEIVAALEQPRADQWLTLARLHLMTRELSRAEQALAQIPMLRAAEEVRAGIAEVRGYWCLAPGSVPTDEEGDFLRELGAAAQALRDNDEGPLETLASQHPQQPGLLALRCERALVGGDAKRGVELCRRALAADEHCYLANFTMGRYEQVRGRYTEARKHLEAAADVYRDSALTTELRRVYRELEDDEALRELEEE